MDYIKVILIALLSVVALFILTKIIGNKQVSQLTIFDYIIGISIGSIAAQMATELERPVRPLIAMAVYALSACVMSFITEKSIKARRVLFGKSKILMCDGVLYRKNLKSAHLDLNEFLMQCRDQGYFDISEINIAVLEPNGRISILPFSDARPVTARDLKIVPNADFLNFNVILEGNILKRNLNAAGFDEKWLLSELKVQGVSDIKEVFLATLNKDGKLSIFKNTGKRMDNDPFE